MIGLQLVFGVHIWDECFGLWDWAWVSVMESFRWAHVSGFVFICGSLVLLEDLAQGSYGSCTFLKRTW